MPDGKVIKPLQKGESYKYLGILERDNFLEKKMKLNVSKEFIRSLRKILKSKLNGGNLVRGVNTWTVSLLRYSAAFVSWRKSEMQAIDRETRKLFTIYGALHPKSDVDRLYIPRKEGGRGLISIEDCVELAIRDLEVYVHGSEERLIQAARGEKIDGLEAASGLKRSKKGKRLEYWEEKVLHAPYLRQTKEVRIDQCLAWLQNGDLKRETESLIVAAQNQSIRTNLGKAKIEKTHGDSLFRVCRKVDESLDHIVIEPESVFENEDYKILWDFSIQTDHVIEAWRPDLVVVDKMEPSCKIIDFAVPRDSRIEEKEKSIKI